MQTTTPLASVMQSGAYPLSSSVQQSGMNSVNYGAQSVNYGAQSVNYGGQSVSYGSQSALRGTPAGPERIQSTRKISSTIVNEQMMGPPPQDLPVREVEVPGPVQEVVTHVPRKEVIETEKRVPKYEYEYVDKIVEVPRIEYVDKVVEVPTYQEVIVEKKVPQIVDVPREVVREVKIPKINYIEKTVEVPGEIIEVPKPYTVEQKVEFTRYNDKKKPVIVAQSVKPVIVEGAGVTEVDVYEYEPEVIPVDVHVVKGVEAQVQAGGILETVHRVVTVPSAQYNTVLQQMNSHLTQVEIQKLPYMTDRSGQVVFLDERVIFADPQHGVVIQGLDMNNLVSTHIDHASRKVHPVNDSAVGMTGGASYVSGTTYGVSSGNFAPKFGGSTTVGNYGVSTGTYGASSGTFGGAANYSYSTGGAQGYRSTTYQQTSYPSSTIQMQPTSTYMQSTYNNVSSSPLQVHRPGQVEAFLS